MYIQNNISKNSTKMYLEQHDHSNFALVIDDSDFEIRLFCLPKELEKIVNELNQSIEQYKVKYPHKFE